jgi:hypothetical protein
MNAGVVADISKEHPVSIFRLTLESKDGAALPPKRRQYRPQPQGVRTQEHD